MQIANETLPRQVAERCGEAVDVARAARVLRAAGMHREAATIEKHFELVRWYRARFNSDRRAA